MNQKMQFDGLNPSKVSNPLSKAKKLAANKWIMSYNHDHAKVLRNTSYCYDSRQDPAKPLKTDLIKPKEKSQIINLTKLIDRETGKIVTV